MNFKAIPKGRFPDSDVIRKAMDDAQANALGRAVVTEMKSLMGKGISPIKKVGRFPEYKNVGAARQAGAAARALSQAGKTEDASHQRAKQADLKRKGYPYSVQDKYPGKMPRPVNLKLSGEQWAALGFTVVQGRIGRVPKINYMTELALQKEAGHREGVHGQPSRPTIPVGGEAPAASLQAIIEKAIRKSVMDLFNKIQKK